MNNYFKCFLVYVLLGSFFRYSVHIASLLRQPWEVDGSDAELFWGLLFWICILGSLVTGILGVINL